MAGWLGGRPGVQVRARLPEPGRAVRALGCGGKSRSLRSGSLGEEWSWLHSQRTVLVGPFDFQESGGPC